MAASAARLEQRQHATGTAGGLTVRAAVDAFLDSPKINRSPHTRRAYANVLDRTADVLGAERDLAGVSDAELGEALTRLWGGCAESTWNRNRAAVAPGWPGVSAGSTGTRRGCRPRSSGAARWRTPRRRCPDHGSTGCADVLVLARLRAGTSLTARLRAVRQPLTKEDGPGWPTCAPRAGPRSSSPATLWAAPCSGPRVSWAWPWPGGPKRPR